MAHMMGGAKLWWPVAPRETTAAIAGDQGSADSAGHGGGGAPDVEGFGVGAEYDGDQGGVAREPAGVGGAEQLPVIQGGGADRGAQRLPVDGDGQVWRFPAAGGEFFSCAGPLTELDEGVGLAFGDSASVGNTPVVRAVGDGTPGGQLFDQ
jgi:hypothetical protein